MRNILIMCGLLVALTTTANAQLIYEITPSAGWRLGGGFNYTLNVTNSTLKFDFESKPSFGIKAAVGFNPSFFIEGEWDRQYTVLSRKGFTVGDEMPLSLDMTIDYYHAAFVFQYAYDRVQPFGFFSLGVTGFYPQNNPDNLISNLSSITRFSMGAGGGLKYFISRMFGLRFQGRFYTTSMNSEYGGVWCGFYGCWGTTRINWLTQWSFTTGVFIRFGGDSRRRRY